MKSAITMEELARIAGVKATTVRKAVREIVEVLEREVAEGRLTLADLDLGETADAPGGWETATPETRETTSGGPEPVKAWAGTASDQDDRRETSGMQS